MAAQSFYFPLPGTPTAEGNKLSFFQAGTSTPAAVYHTSAPGTPWAQPIVLNEDGQPEGPIYLSSSVPSLKVVYTDSTGQAIAGYPYDNMAVLEVA